MTASLSIRFAVPEDYKQWKVLWGGYNAFYGRKDSTALSDDIINSTWQRFFDEAEPVNCLVAERGKELLGIAHYIFHRSTITIESTCYLQDLFTSEAARGNGVGHALISELYNQAENAGVKNVYWQTHETNETAKRLYDRIALNTNFTVYRKRV